MSLELLRPLIVPSSYFTSGAFPAPHIPLRAPDLALTCVLLQEPAAVLYVQPQMVAEWQTLGIQWEVAALDAMREADDGLVWTQEARDEDGALMWIGLMHDDGLGSSRLLFHKELEDLFPEGYYVALPDRSCGMAVSKHLEGEQLEEVRALVAEMHSSATVPMCSDLREPSALLSRAA